MAIFNKLKSSHFFQRKRGSESRGRTADLSKEDLISLTSATKTLVNGDSGTTFLVDRAAGVVVTLPAATGSGVKFKFVVATTITSNAFKVACANTTDKMLGRVVFSQDSADTLVSFDADDNTHDYFSCNGSTTGGLKGDVWSVVDIGSNRWLVEGIGSATGTEATPFGST